MFHLELATPVFLNAQLEDLATQLGYDIDTLTQIANHKYPSYWVFKQDIGPYKKFDMLPVMELRDDGAWHHVDLPEAVSEEFVTTGTDAILWLCEQKYVKVSPLTRVDIPITVFEVATDNQWYGISTLFARLSNRNARLGRIIQMRAPDVIIRAEQRMLWEAVEMLENPDSFGKEILMRNNKPAIGLNRIGFSILTGWEDNLFDDENE